MNETVTALGLAAWKPVVTALLLPPVPLLALMVLGAARWGRGRASGRWIVAIAVALVWLSATSGAAEALESVLHRRHAALGPERLQALRTLASEGAPAAVVVLGGGLEPLAPEYGGASLRPDSLERLRYGVWLARTTGLPLGFSGGLGHAQQAGEAEARIAARIAADEYGLPLRWIEDRARDTRENAAETVRLMRASGIEHVVLVTHASHMRRAMRAFVERAGPGMRIEAAPMGLARGVERPLLRWLPSSAGFRDTRVALRELLGFLAGA